MDRDNRSYAKKRRMRRIFLHSAAALLLGLSITACAGDANNVETLQSTAAAESAAQVTGEIEEGAKKPDETGISETEETRAEKDVKDAALPNPVRAVDSPDEFESIGLKLELPVNDNWSSEPVYSIIDDRVAQIQFHDEITGSDAMARAGKAEDGDISGVYYVFDDSKKQSWFTDLEDGTRVYITIEVTTDNSDVHGVLATWTCKDINYTLWEDDAREHPDAVAKMAVEIMRMSDPSRVED